jgi:hypothetical protein
MWCGAAGNCAAPRISVTLRDVRHMPELDGPQDGARSPPGPRCDCWIDRDLRPWCYVVSVEPTRARYSHAIVAAASAVISAIS